MLVSESSRCWTAPRLLSASGEDRHLSGALRRSRSSNGSGIPSLNREMRVRLPHETPQPHRWTVPSLRNSGRRIVTSWGCHDALARGSGGDPPKVAASRFDSSRGRSGNGERASRQSHKLEIACCECKSRVRRRRSERAGFHTAQRVRSTRTVGTVFPRVTRASDFARVAEQADAPVSEAGDPHGSCWFDSSLVHLIPTWRNGIRSRLRICALRARPGSSPGVGTNARLVKR